jgi:hypothetical protein
MAKIDVSPLVHYAWTKNKKTRVLKKARQTPPEHRTLVEMAVLEDWADNHDSYCALYGLLRSALEHIETGSTRTAMSILGHLLEGGV